MLLQSSWAVLLLGATAGFLGWLGLAALPEKVGTPPQILLETTTSDSRLQDEGTSQEEELWETWMRSALEETPVAQLVQDISRRMGDLSSRGAAELRAGHQVVPSSFHQEQERPRGVHPQPESILLLQEVMEKLQRVNQSLELMLTALEDARSRLEKHLEHLKSIPAPDGQSQSVTSSCIPHGSYLALLVLPLVPAPFQPILLLLFLASRALGVPAISTLLVLAAAGHWVASACRGAGRIRPVVPREKARYRLTSTPERYSILDAPSLVPHPEFPILDVPPCRHLVDISREGQDTSWMAFLQLWGISSHLHVLFLLSVTSLGVPSWCHLQERTEPIPMAFLWLLDTSSHLPDLFLLREGCGEVHVSLVVVTQKPPRRQESGFPSSHTGNATWSCCKRSWTGWR
ncbi:uncharacterized protein LOC135286389 isoform X1 [Passer domesticus]|uniref:uncharacterized protein LOC135286389 isoform X1 n=1 Tax=Passer domesticus TaxID=48849 RepID=UPI0030FED9DF